MQGNEQRITVIDDNQDLTDVLVEFLDSKGFSATGLYGIENINQLVKTQPDLVIVDLQMPGLTGYGILDLMKESVVLSSVPTILITAMPITADQVPHASELMQKPLNLKVLHELVSRLLTET